MKASEWREWVHKHPDSGTEILMCISDLAACEKERDEWKEAAIDWENDYSKKRSVWQDRAEKAEAERDVLKAELADYKEAWEARESEETGSAAEQRWEEVRARIRARREKEATEMIKRCEG